MYIKGQERTADFLRKYESHKLVNRYISLGIIKKPSHCQHCGKKIKRLDSHHEDYDLPLDILWVCLACHWKLHSNGMKLTEDDFKKITKNKQDTMKNLADYSISLKGKKDKRRRYNILKSTMKKTWKPPVIIKSGNVLRAICQECNYVWILRSANLCSAHIAIG